MVIEVLAGRTTASRAAEELGTTEENVHEWTALYLDGALHAVARPASASRTVARALRFLAPAAALVSLLVFVGHARSQGPDCPQTLPAPLVTFCPQSAARASQVNGNFQQIVDWIEQKIGSVTSAGVMTTTVNAGAVNATAVSGTTVNATTTMSAPTVTATSLVSAPTVRATGTVSGTNVTASNNITATGDISGRDITATRLIHGALGRDSCTWRDARHTTNTEPVRADNTVHWNPNDTTRSQETNHHTDYHFHVAACINGEYQAGWACYSTTYLDGYCRILCCMP